jgi:hypothetical protein
LICFHKFRLYNFLHLCRPLCCVVTACESFFIIIIYFNLANKRRSCGRYSSLANYGHRVFFLFILTANGFSPGGSGTTVRHNTQTTHITFHLCLNFSVFNIYYVSFIFLKRLSFTICPSFI